MIYAINNMIDQANPRVMAALAKAVTDDVPSA
jgi:hypothetical protein